MALVYLLRAYTENKDYNSAQEVEKFLRDREMNENLKIEYYKNSYHLFKILNDELLSRFSFIYWDFPGKSILGYNFIKFKIVTLWFRLNWFTKYLWKSEIPPLKGIYGPTETILRLLFNYFFYEIFCFMVFVYNYFTY